LHPKSHEERRLVNFRHICYRGYDRQVRREENIITKKSGGICESPRGARDELFAQHNN
jgi:hypothetical protein